jgi:dethiobiotin synthetase
VGEREKTRVVVVTGSDTGVGKTVLTALLTRRLRAEGVGAVALKPLCSGGRGDAVALHAANGGVLTMDEVNPWYFRAPLAPVLAARREGRGVTLAEVVAQVRAVARRFEVVLVEGAGGLLSPLGEHFDNRDLLAALRAVPVVVVPNRLGAVNQARLVLEALPRAARKRTQVVLVELRDADATAGTNAALLAELAPGQVIVQLPWLKSEVAPNKNPTRRAGGRRSGRAATALDSLVAALRG